MMVLLSYGIWKEKVMTPFEYSEAISNMAIWPIQYGIDWKDW